MALPKLETPTYELVLPSTNQTIVYRPFFVKEHKILMTLKDVTDNEILRVVKELVDACTFNKLKLKDLANFDIEYIFINLRAKSIGETLDLIINCECENKIDYILNLLEAKVKKNKDHSNKIQLTSSIGIEMRYPTFDEVVNAYQKNDQEEIIKLVIKCIKGIYDTNGGYWYTEDYTDEEIYNFTNDLTKNQFDKIEEFFVTMPKIEHTVEADCDKCGKHNVIKLEGLQSFFV
jgi:hypothetical protein